uniref:nucleotide modification associated domain-containing protein n=1 Tax=uncultured Proteiniphilum sp. TaxID=497637 RepID=UPI00262D826B
MDVTHHQFDEVIAICRAIFVKKLQDYGAAWRILRPGSVTDQIFIKAKRIRTLEMKKDSRVDEGIFPEYIGIVNYGIVGLIQLQLGYVDTVDISAEKALDLYDRFTAESKELMDAKNHDYGEAWRSMRMSSYTDLIL